MENSREECCWKSLVVACRVLGIITALVLWGVGVEYVFHGALFGIYYLIIAIVVSFLEVVFLLNHVVELCVRQTSLFMRMWDIVLCLDDWKKGGLYFVVFSPPCFVKPAEVELGIPAGCLLIVTGILYMLKTLKTKRDEEKEDRMLPNTPYDRFEDDQEYIEDDIINPTNNLSVGMTSVADQSEILDL
ncbi:transmembrane protein 72 [Biomphalaria glabrata]|uniref:Transmembrane protein 72-like n=1 Tax=Biomphalaria glabrata TaxID=6526 RepID=A0A9U8ECR7_BIOGL|nr:transmembrane protein 72-like [Biomphalaria glabrata]KAI8765568.1 transmembrane protein 72-like [Biomphalaria glabrata]